MSKGKFYVSLIPLVYAVVAVFAPYIDGKGHIGAAEGIQLAIGVLTAFSVHLVPLVPQHPGVKTAIGAALSGLGVLATVIVGGVTAAEWLDVAVYVLAALGIWVAPAESDTGTAVGVGSDAVVSRGYAH
jgi:hypothetical protein